MTVGEQIDLDIRPHPSKPVADVPVEVVLRQPSRLAVIRLQVQASGLTDDQVCHELGLDPAQWSRIMSGRAHFPTEKYQRLNQVTGSHYILMWDIYQAGFDPASLRPLRSDLERRLEEEREARRELEREMETMRKYMAMMHGRG